MKKLLSLIFAIGLTLSACGTASTQPTQTGTPTITPTATQTPTSTITPLPTIPTFTPTFDVSTIVTVTPAVKAECPSIQRRLSIKLPQKMEESLTKDEVTNNYIKPIIDYLNSGGNPQGLLEELTRKYGSVTRPPGESLDLTNDGINEIIIRYPAFIIFSCREKEYNIIYQKDPVAHYEVYEDLNFNGIPELVSYLNICSGSGCLSVSIMEWKGFDFESIGSFAIQGPVEKGFEFVDIDGNGVKELVITGEKPSPFRAPGTIPERIKTITYVWDGITYVETKIQYESPTYRFQAIQDADREVLYGEFKKAVSLYQNAINSENLEWWSHERQIYLDDIFYQNLNSTHRILSTPTYDLSEFPRLAAYAYYRIILLHLVQGQETEAASTYQTLQDTLGTDPYATPYVEMATEFWEAYQSTHKMYDGCAAAIQYAVEHPEILTPLGSDYHGWQSHTYVPADVCPFR